MAVKPNKKADGLILLIVFSFSYMFAAIYTAIIGRRMPLNRQTEHDIRINIFSRPAELSTIQKPGNTPPELLPHHLHAILPFNHNPPAWQMTFAA
jgi:hypothetical protein